MIEVLPIGTKVKLGFKQKYEGFISGIFIGPKNEVKYECVWWEDAERNCDLLHYQEFETVEYTANRTSIGFLKGDQD